MANTNLPSTKRFYSEDYKDAPPYFQRFLGQSNLFTEPMYNIVNAGIDITQNTLGEFYTYTISNANATGSSNTYTFTPKKFAGAPHGVFKAQISLISSSGLAMAIGALTGFDWTWTGSQIKILAVYGLTAGANYTVTLLIQ